MVGRDVIAAGYSLEAEPGSVVGEDMALAGSQGWLGGEIEQDLSFSGAGLEIQGTVAGDLDAMVGSSKSPTFDPKIF